MLREFTAEENFDTGFLGWRDKRARGPYEAWEDGRALAHDCLEHLPYKGSNGLETVADEIRAHGSILWLRGDELSTKDMAYEWINLTHAINAGYCLAPFCGKTRKLDSYTENQLAQIMTEGENICRKEFSKDLYHSDISEHFANYFRQGYRNAQKD